MFTPVSCCPRIISRVPLQQWAPWLSVQGNKGGVGVAALHTGTIMEAARKGTRAKAEAKKKAHKKVEVKKEFIPLKKRLEMQQSGGVSPRRVEDHLKDPVDNVWITRYYKWKMYSVKEALAMHRESHHPTLMNLPHAFVTACFQLDMTAEKKNRYLDNFQNVVRLPHEFDTEQVRNVLVVSRNEEMLETARQMGVTHASGLEIVKQVQNGEASLTEYQHVLTEVDILPDLVPIRGVLKRLFPSVRNGTAGPDLIPIIQRFMKGVSYSTIKNKFHHDFATVEAPFGRLSQSDEELEENLATLVKDVHNFKPKKVSHPFITMLSLQSQPSPENFKVDHTLYMSERRQENVKVAAAV